MITFRFIIFISLIVTRTNMLAQVGIGTNNPQATLDVEGRIAIKAFTDFDDTTGKLLRIDNTNPALLNKDTATEISDLGTVLGFINTTTFNITAPVNSNALDTSVTPSFSAYHLHGKSSSPLVIEKALESADFIIGVSLLNCRAAAFNTCPTSLVMQGSPSNVASGFHDATIYVISNVNLLFVDTTGNSPDFNIVLGSVRSLPQATLAYSDFVDQGNLTTRASITRTNIPVGSYDVYVYSQKRENVPSQPGTRGVFMNNLGYYNPTEAEWTTVFNTLLEDITLEVVSFEAFN